MRILVVLLFCFGCTAGRKSARDADVDGLSGGADRCPEQAETLNGWRDDDGCPDELARLLVTVTMDGAPVEDAEVTLPGAAPRRTDAVGRVAFFELFPVAQGVFVRVSAEGARRDVSASLNEGANEVLVELAVGEKPEAP